MKRSPHIARGVRYVAAACACVLVPHLALGGVSTPVGTYTITQDPDNAAATSNKTTSGSLPLSGLMPTPGSYQYGLKTLSNTGSTTFLANGPKTSANGSVGAISTPATVGFTFASGSGVTQDDPTGTSFVGQSQLRFNVDATWTVTAGGFGPSVYGYLAFTLGGTIPNGDSIEVDISDLRWFNPVGGADYRTPIVNKILDFPSALPFPYTYTNQAVLSSASLTTGSKVEVSGIIDLRAKDPGALVNLQPLSFEASSAPPTWNYLVGSGSHSFSDSNSWSSDSTDVPGSSLGPIPNAPGVRALFQGTSPPAKNPSSDSQFVSVDSQVTVGMIDIDLQDADFTDQGGHITLANDPTSGADCVIFARNTHDYLNNSDGHNFAVGVTLTRNTDIINDCPGPLNFFDPIDGAGGIIKSGLGPLVLSAPNSFAGGVVVNGGNVIAAAGSASWGGGPVQINANSQATVSGGPGSSVFTVNDLGCISGTAADLSQLNVGSNFILPAAGSHAIIAHQTFDTGTTGNPVGLGSSPQQIFGISNDFNSPGGTESIIIGDQSGDPWSGFSNDTQARTFGSGPATSSQSILIQGNAQLVALQSELVINAPIQGISLLNSITKLGQGLVALENVNNSYTGPMTVQSGAVAIDGTWNASGSTSSSVSVNANAALGGTGTIKSNVEVFDNAHIQPGMVTAISGPTDAAIPTTVQGPGVLTIVGNLTLHHQSQLDYDLDDPSADSDTINIIGDLALDGVVNVHDGPNFNPDAVYTLMTYTGTLTSPSPSLALGAIVPDDFVAPGGISLDSDFQSNYPLDQIVIVPNGSGAGGVVLLEAVPEPGTIALLGFASLIGLRRRRR